jgi:hypothetical protein
MSVYLILLGLIVVLGLLNAILIYRNRLQHQQHTAEIQKTITEAVLSQATHREQLDKNLEEIHEKHREETIIERAHLADRSYLDNDWGGVSDAGAGYVAPNSAAVASEPASVAGDNSQRVGLSE